MLTYPKLYLDDESKARLWPGDVNDYWRAVDRSRANVLGTAVQDTLRDAVRYCTARPEDPMRKAVLPDHFIQRTSNAVDELPSIVQALSELVRVGAAPSSIGMLSNWVNLLNYSVEFMDAVQCAWVLRDTVKWLTQQDSVHPWDTMLVYMAAHLTHEFGKANESDSISLANTIAQDTNAERLATRLMAAMEHTGEGELWWKTVNAVHGGSPDAPMPALPDARASIERKERAHQAWWRYTDEMRATPEFAWVRDWTASLISPTRDASYPTNGLL